MGKIVRVKRARTTKDKYMRPLSHAFQPLTRAGGSSTGTQQKGVFCVSGLDRLLRRHLHDQGPIEMRNDAKPHRKRVEAYSAAMTPAQGVCVGQFRGCHFWNLQRVPLMTDAKRPRTLFFVGLGLFCPRTLEARYKGIHECK